MQWYLIRIIDQLGGLKELSGLKKIFLVSLIVEGIYTGLDDLLYPLHRNSYYFCIRQNRGDGLGF